MMLQTTHNHICPQSSVLDKTVNSSHYIGGMLFNEVVGFQKPWVLIGWGKTPDANFSIKSDARPVMSLKITQNAASSQPCPCITLSYFSFSSSSSHISPLAPTFHFTGVFAQKCHRWKKQKKKNHKQDWDSKLLWMIVIINHLCMIYTSFPVQMYRITLCKKKLNMYAITGLVDKKYRIFIYHCWQEDKAKWNAIKTVYCLNFIMKINKEYIMTTSHWNPLDKRGNVQNHKEKRTNMVGL